MDDLKSYRKDVHSYIPVNHKTRLKPAVSQKLLEIEPNYDSSLAISNEATREPEVDGPDIRRLYHRTVKHKWAVADLHDEYGRLRTRRSQLTRGARRKLSIPAP